MSESEVSDSEPESETSEATSECMHTTRTPGLTHHKVLKDDSSADSERVTSSTGFFKTPLDGDSKDPRHLPRVVTKCTLENAGFRPRGETEPEPSTDLDDIPIRLLEDFTLFKEQSHQMVPFEEMLHDFRVCASPRSSYSAVGKVMAYAEDDSESDNIVSDFQWHSLELSTIKEVSIHDSLNDGKLDPRIWIRTGHAWYIINNPSSEYQSFFVPFKIKHSVFHVLMTTSKNPELKYEEFIAQLRSSEVSEQLTAMLGRELSSTDVEKDDTVAYLLSILDGMDRSELPVCFGQVPAVQHVLGSSWCSELDLVNNSKTDRQRKLGKGHVELGVFQKRNTTTVTPLVGSLATRMFEQGFSVLGELDREDWTRKDMYQSHAVHHTNMNSVEWLDSGTEFLDTTYYQGVELDGIEYKAVRGPSPQTHLEIRNGDKSSVLFTRIWYFYENSTEKGFHGQWFVHGSKTILQEIAHPNSLYPTATCNDLSLDSITQKCHVNNFQFGDSEPEVGDEENDFHVSIYWDEVNSSFLDLDIPDSFHPCRIYVHYDDIKSRASRHGRRQCHEGRAYVIYNDNPDAKDVTDWIRDEDHFYVHQFSDSSLVSEDSLETLSKSIFTKTVCGECYDRHLDELRCKADYLKRSGCLQGLELFCGAGGLGTGLEMSGFVDTKWAADISPSSTKTFGSNHPNAIVYNQCTSLLLQHAMAVADCDSPKPLKSLGTNENLPSMPQPGDVDFIYGGPPCQPFSRMNSHKKSDDIRPRFFLLENVLGMLGHKLEDQIRREQDNQLEGCHPKKRSSDAQEELRPHANLGVRVASWLVCPTVRHALSGFYGSRPIYCQTMINTELIPGQIKFGVVKFITRCLLTLGYQVHFKVLNAGQYGAPQSRQRIIFWGAKHGELMPAFPLPTHSLQNPLQKSRLPTGSWSLPVTWDRKGLWLLQDCVYEKAAGLHSCAPFDMVTIEDAIGDLPPFDWEHPNPTENDREESKARQDIGILAFPAVRTETCQRVCGFETPAHYVYPPMTSYQQAMRRKDAPQVTYHYTTLHKPTTVEKWGCNLFQFSKLSKIQQSTPEFVYFGRCSSIHPTQKRGLSIREVARAQGFPDHYKLESFDQGPHKLAVNQLRQLGNAVPIPLSHALGRSLGETLVKMWQESHKYRPPSPEL
ncbi:S-adenosyl-L-methionine-dependent methyltransferase [Coniophora puteana RWD-64-598 SS2]|uniref:DNA (cytosine-5-)-methyltransferase n=1 Tax=Coniophora puteana (strain RWD-64-598) TaxID=741705 RepID=R7SED2_CONPW|nr:S-adenosyl-L-methionine-dependent methyltransferase [Coniophora puteana RWD-64-598 SS2]EIW74107.1 S-adenosyl-L-methionine-dependent methyltransferase [Coniophora puteana RWD-64-598 SS2]